ncbi:MAG: UDP-N-acetylmuramoyl-tripeptide--D-alanyl-D-alanine ligase [Ignavibacteriaceae bacterium]
MRLTLEDIFEIPGAVIYNPDNYRSVGSVSIDSRKIKKNSLFVAIKGEKFDGHDFISQVIKKGVSAVMLNENKYKNYDDLNLPVITVKDTIKGYGDLAKMWRRKLNAKVIGITGSAGKTSTKEMIASLLSEKYKVNKTILNNNNHIGVPLTILSTNEKHQVLVLELGTNHFGEISHTSKIAEPDYALITNIGNSHLEFLKNKKGVLKEKIALFEATKRNNGTLFVNYDDPMLKKSFSNYKNRVSYSFSSDTIINGNLRGTDKGGKEIVEVKYKNTKISGAFFYGEQNARNLLAASAVAFKLGLNKTQILRGIKKIKSVDKRLNIKNYKKRITLINDTYNANPESMRYSIELLNKISKGRKKIAVLGDMLELGTEGRILHKKLAQVIKQNKINEVMTIGTWMWDLHIELKRGQLIAKHFSNRFGMRKSLSNYDFENSVILVKGSRGMKMEEFVKVIEDKING